MKRIRAILAVTMLLAIGCFEKQQDSGELESRAEEMRGDTPSAAGAAADGGEASGDAAAEGEADEDRPEQPANADNPDDPGPPPAEGANGDADEGAPGGAPPGDGPGPAGAPPGHQTPFEIDFADKPMVTISGTLLTDPGVDGVVDIDCFAPKDGGDKNRELVNKVKVQQTGEYSFVAPAGFGALYLEAFIDRDSDGPDDGDARGEYAGNPLTIGDEDIRGVDIELIQPAKSSGGGAWRGGGRRQNQTDE